MWGTKYGFGQKRMVLTIIICTKETDCISVLDGDMQSAFICAFKSHPPKGVKLEAYSNFKYQFFWSDRRE